jgi:hypothetical protein
MGLAAGTRLGGYEVVALIGAGGMGEFCTDVCIGRLPHWQIGGLQCH